MNLKIKKAPDDENLGLVNPVRNSPISKRGKGVRAYLFFGRPSENW